MPVSEGSHNVLARVVRLYHRYAARHLALTKSGPAIADADGQPIGRIDRIALRNDRLTLAGHADADVLVLELAGRRRVVVPGEAQGAATGSAHGRFQLDLPFSTEPAMLTVTRHGREAPAMELAGFGRLRLGLGRAALVPAFVWAGLRATPAALRWFRFHDMAARERVKLFLGLGPVVEELRLEPAQFPASDAAAPITETKHAPGLLRILMPVYEAFDLLPEVLERISHNTDMDWTLTLVEDASPNPAIRPFLRAWAAGKPQVRLIENPRNLGFVGSMNLGIAAILAEPEPAVAIVFLNSDALVPPGWASRLVAPLRVDPRLASVTPMSNDAELMSVPVICARTALKPGAGDAIDRVARHLPHDISRLPEAPTGVGFCMAVNPAFLALEPQFDPAFGRGYGEEVDWCQKILARGGKHLCLPGLFVEHRGGASFGSAAKQALLRQNGAMISGRYPRFDADVQRFIGDDPLLTGRLALGLAWAGELGARVPIYLAHSLGGGAEHYLTDRIAADVNHGAGVAVVLRVGGNFRWEIALHSQVGITRGGTGDRDLVLRLLRLLRQRNVVYSCAVADPDPLGIPGLLQDLAEGQELEILMHDYLPLSPSYALTGSDGVFHGVPRTDTVDRAHGLIRPDGSRVDLAEWRAVWGGLLARADRVVVFSQSSRQILADAYPALGQRVQVVPHRLLTAVPKLERGATGQPVIGVLGNIGAHKGAAVLAALSRCLKGKAGLVVLGKLDPSYRLRPPARVHGGYEPQEIASLAARYGITCWLIPSVWPETFSYTTHESLATGLPVITLDLGAQAEAVRAAMTQGAPGSIVPFGPASEAAPAILAAARSLCAAPVSASTQGSPR